MQVPMTQELCDTTKSSQRHKNGIMFSGPSKSETNPMNHEVDSLMTSPHTCTTRGAISTSGPSSASLWNTVSSCPSSQTKVGGRLACRLATNAAVLATLVLSPVKGFFGHLQGVPDFMDNSPAIQRRSVRNWEE